MHISYACIHTYVAIYIEREFLHSLYFCMCCLQTVPIDSQLAGYIIVANLIIVKINAKLMHDHFTSYVKTDKLTFLLQG